MSSSARRLHYAYRVVIELSPGCRRINPKIASYRRTGELGDRLMWRPADPRPDQNANKTSAEGEERCYSASRWSGTMGDG